MINYECDRCKRPIAGRDGVATITIATCDSDDVKLEFCKDCVPKMLPQTDFAEHPKYQWLQTVASWMDARNEVADHS